MWYIYKMNNPWKHYANNLQKYRKVIYSYANAEFENTWLISIDQKLKDYRVTERIWGFFSGMVKYYKIH